MTVNKSQGQSLHRGGIFCSRDFFSYGQFNVAASRVGRSSSLYAGGKDAERVEDALDSADMEEQRGCA